MTNKMIQPCYQNSHINIIKSALTKKKKPFWTFYLYWILKKNQIKNNSPTWKIQMEVCFDVYLPGETLLDQQ